MQRSVFAEIRHCLESSNYIGHSMLSEQFVVCFQSVTRFRRKVVDWCGPRSTLNSLEYILKLLKFILHNPNKNLFYSRLSIVHQHLGSISTEKISISVQTSVKTQRVRSPPALYKCLHMTS